MENELEEFLFQCGIDKEAIDIMKEQKVSATSNAMLFKKLIVIDILFLGILD